MKIYYPSYEQNRKHILQHTDFIESVVMNTHIKYTLLSMVS